MTSSRFSVIALLLSLSNVFCDTTHPMNINADNLANLVLAHAGECQLNDHEVTQQVFD